MVSSALGPVTHAGCKRMSAARCSMCSRYGSGAGIDAVRLAARRLCLRRIESAVRLDRIKDELLVLNGSVLRLEGREVETTGLKAIFDRHERGLADVGRRLLELEGAQKGA
jgi:hypothetical protein